MSKFKIVSKYGPKGDQPEAIKTVRLKITNIKHCLELLDPVRHLLLQMLSKTQANPGYGT